MRSRVQCWFGTLVRLDLGLFFLQQAERLVSNRGSCSRLGVFHTAYPGLPHEPSTLYTNHRRLNREPRQTNTAWYSLCCSPADKNVLNRKMLLRQNPRHFGSSLIWGSPVRVVIEVLLVGTPPPYFAEGIMQRQNRKLCILTSKT